MEDSIARTVDRRGMQATIAVAVLRSGRPDRCRSSASGEFIGSTPFMTGRGIQ